MRFLHFTEEEMKINRISLTFVIVVSWIPKMLWDSSVVGREAKTVEKQSLEKINNLSIRNGNTNKILWKIT